jgi:carboxymethylenebutenolidase
LSLHWPCRRKCGAGLAVADFIAFAPDALTSLGGYPGDDEKGLALFQQLDRGYGAQPSAAEAAKIKAPINAQYGEQDTRITDGWPAFDAALTEAKAPHEGHVYKGANHGFHNDTTPRYDEAAAKEAWQRTLDWFNKYLRV